MCPRDDIDNDPDDKPPDPDRARSCCGCLFFLLVLLIWVGLALGVYLNAIVQRKILVTNATDARFNDSTLICGWNRRVIQNRPIQQNFQSELSYADACASGISQLCNAKANGELYFGLIMGAIPFGILLAASCCLSIGSREEVEDKDEKNWNTMSPPERKEYEALMHRRLGIHRCVKLLGVLGVFGFEIGASVAFGKSWNDCMHPLDTAQLNAISSPPPAEPPNFQLVGSASQGISSVLVFAGLGMTGLLIIVVVMFIILLTSEQSQGSLNIIGAAVAVLNCMKLDECPECTGAIDCGAGCTVCCEDLCGDCCDLCVSSAGASETTN